MRSIQYTVRSIPPILDKALRKRAKDSGKSLNEITVESLLKGAGVDPHAEYHDLDWFIGSKTIDQKAFTGAMRWLNSAPNDLDS